MPRSVVSRIGVALTVAVAIAAVGVAVMLATGQVPGDGTSSSKTGQGEALIGGPFTLVDHEGDTRTAEDFAGRPMLVYFGYTYCPDVCPTGLQTLSDALDRLGALGETVQPVFITVDPARDTVPVMADYVAHFHPRLVGLTGTEEQVAQVAKAYRIYRSVPEAGGDDYLVDHSSFTYLMGPDGAYLDHFSHGVSADAMADRIREILSAPTS